MSPTPSLLVAVPKPPRIHREPKPMRRQNRKRAAARRVEDFGDLASFVRTLPCCVRGCESRDIDPAHVRARRNAHAWLEVDGMQVGNIAPLCRGHHTGAPGGPRRPQHQIGVRAFEQENAIELRLPGRQPLNFQTLAEVAAAIGEAFNNATPAQRLP